MIDERVEQAIAQATPAEAARLLGLLLVRPLACAMLEDFARDLAALEAAGGPSRLDGRSRPKRRGLQILRRASAPENR